MKTTNTTKTISIMFMICDLALIVLFFALLSGCSHSGKVRDISDEFSIESSHGHTSQGEAIILDKNSNAFVQETTPASTELRIQETVNEHLTEQYESEEYALERCQSDLADPRLGGNGVAPEFISGKELKDPAAVKEALGLVNDELVIVKQSDFRARLKAEKKLTVTLRKMTKLVVSARKRCEARMAIARRSAGLPSSRYTAEGYFTRGGVWVENRKAEHSLDDAFEIAGVAKKKAQPKGSVNSMTVTTTQSHIDETELQPVVAD